MTKASHRNVFRPEEILALVSGTYELVLREIDDEHLLILARTLTKADNVSLICWQDNDPDTQSSWCAGEPAELPAGLIHWLNNSLHRKIELPVSLNELAEAHPVPDSAVNELVKNPQLMAVLLDTTPSRMLILFTRNSASPAWSDAERQSYMAVAAIMRQAVRMHKFVDSMKGFVATSQGLANSSPIGMVVMRPDGKITNANHRAKQILNRGDGISIRNDKLLINQNLLNDEFQQLLSSAAKMSAEKARNFQWHRGVPRRSSKTAYQLSVHMLNLPEWHIQSSHFDKVVVAFMADPLRLAVPNSDQFKRYYGFTDAQAKVALALWGGTGIGEAATKLSISVNTARTHLRAIYEKTGVANHAELMAVLTTSLNRSNRFVDEIEPVRPDSATLTF